MVSGRGGREDPLEVELAETIVATAEGASGLGVRVGIADGKFAAYVAAVLGEEIRGATRREEVIPQAVLGGAKDLYLNMGTDRASGAGGTNGMASAPASKGSFPPPVVRGRYGRGLPDPGGSALPEVER